MKKGFWVSGMFALPRVVGCGALAAALSLAWSIRAPARPGGQAPPASADPRVTVEGYYKIAPGKTEEWLELYRTHHLPVLKQRQRDGQILQIVIYRPLLHQGEPAWDFKVLLTYRDFAALGDRTSFDAIDHRLYPDWEAHQRAERHRWEITAKHWDDLMVTTPAD